MATIVKPPSPLPDGFSVFLAGSIELGMAGNWQAFLEKQLFETDLILFNPRREEWDGSWRQSMDDPNFREQVEWELEAQERASLIAMYLEPSTKSPVSLLELGLFARSGKMIVCCPQGFWRKGNVDIVCARYDVKQVDSLKDLGDEILRLAHQRQGKISC